MKNKIMNQRKSKKILAIILTLTISLSSSLVSIPPVSAFANGMNCNCCDDCTNDTSCECGCLDCQYCQSDNDDINCSCCDECTNDTDCTCNCRRCRWCENDSSNDDESDCTCCEQCTQEKGCTCGCEDCEYKSDKSDEDIKPEAPEGDDPEEFEDVYTQEERNFDYSHFLSYQYCGDTMFWFVRNKVLYIFGNGDMYNYSQTQLAPWHSVLFKKVVIRANVESIGNYAFYDCGFEKAEIPSGITTIGRYAFARNDELTFVKLGKGVETLGEAAFLNCSSLTNVTLNNELKKLGKSVFQGCTSLTDIRMPKTIKTIPEKAFYLCSELNTIVLRSGLISIKQDAFNGCSHLENINFTDTLVSIGNSSFKDCKLLSELNFQNRIKSIGDNTFENCKSLEAFNSNCIKEIGSYAFKNSGLRSANIPSMLHNYNKNAFDGCKATVLKVFRNGQAYKDFISSNSNVKVVCAEHDNTDLPYSKATLSADGALEGYICRGCNAKTVTKPIYKISKIQYSTCYYNNKNQHPNIKVYNSKGQYISPSNYSVSYPKKSKNVGQYYAKITFKGNYSGSKTICFTIAPSNTSLSKVSPFSKGFTVYWKKQSSQISGYQVQYSEKSNFSKAKTVTVNKSSAVSLKLQKLSKNKKYYVRIRTFKKVGKNVYYSYWSSSKTVKTKK